MNAYTDVFKNPISVDDVRTAALLVVRIGKASPSVLQRQMQVGYGKAAKLIKILEDAGVISEAWSRRTTAKSTYRSVILKNEDTAVNAALRQLKKGNK